MWSDVCGILTEESCKNMPLIYVKNQSQVYAFELPVDPGAEIVLGSAPTSSVLLPVEAGVAPVHARIILRPEGYVIEDLQSGYGTFQNGRPVQTEYMMPGVDYMLGMVGICYDPQVNAAYPQGEGAPQQQASGRSGAVKKSPLRRSKTPARGALDAKQLQAMSANYRRSGGGGFLKTLYVIILFIVAFYAGIALHHWQRTGNFLPGIVEDGDAGSDAPESDSTEDS